MAVERLAASDFVIALLFVMRVWPRTKPSLVRNGSHGLSDSPIPVASSRLYPGLHDQGVLRPSTVLLSLKGIAMLNEVHHLLDLFRTGEPRRWLFGEPIPKCRKIIRPAQRKFHNCSRRDDLLNCLEHVLHNKKMGFMVARPPPNHAEWELYR